MPMESEGFRQGGYDVHADYVVHADYLGMLRWPSSEQHSFSDDIFKHTGAGDGPAGTAVVH
jgi:hypothetical protein